ncbi:MAG: TAXI family TRAP transporter solute-binding subunit [Bifidobacteriaceae bacterium]|jgi:TRAP transporter TAXI family solute receptor|nr:TAXI family TRAP transporter solute-binding subunit [Bifidobacteriaceae bacterium]
MPSKSRSLLIGLSLLAAAVALTGCGFKGPPPRAEGFGGVDRSRVFVTVLTGPTSGAYYPVGGAFATVLGEAGYKTAATATGATAENVKALMARDGDLAIAMADSAVQAYNATDAFEGQDRADGLRVMMSLWPSLCQIVTTADTGIKAFEDLRGKRVSVGAPNTGVEVNARAIFAAHGMTYDDAKVGYLDFGLAVDQIARGNLDAAFVTSAAGNASIENLGANRDLTLVPVEGEALKRLTADGPHYVEARIPAEAYGIGQDVTTAAVMNVLLVSKDLPDAVVRDMLGVFYGDGLRQIADSHDAVRESVALETALRGIVGIDVPLHPGAKAFYASRGMSTE